MTGYPFKDSSFPSCFFFGQPLKCGLMCILVILLVLLSSWVVIKVRVVLCREDSFAFFFSIGGVGIVYLFLFYFSLFFLVLFVLCFLF